MTVNLKHALGLSLGLHAAVLGGWPVTEPAAFDVERAPTSVELTLVATPPKAPVIEPVEAQPESAREPEVNRPLQKPVADPQTVVTDEHRGAVVEVLPNYLRNPPPVYPRLARERGYEGTVLLEIEVLASGRCGTVNVLTSSGYDVLDSAAVNAVRQWVFKPARRWRQPVAFWVEIPVTFRLIEGEAAW